MSLPTVPIGPLQVSRLIIGGNPFSGISHQSSERDAEMLDYYTADRIKRTLADCEAAGINTCVLRGDAHIMRLLREYWNEGGKIQWFAQTAPEYINPEANIDRIIGSGAAACYLHGGVADGLYVQGKLDRIAELVERIKSKGVPAGVAGHAPEVHLAIHEADIPVDFHMVSLYDCGSVHGGEGEKFDPSDPPKAVAAIQQIDKPCLAYKIFGAGRRDARETLEFTFKGIKPTDAAVMGVFTKDNPRMVEENAEMAIEAIVSGSRV